MEGEAEPRTEEQEEREEVQEKEEDDVVSHLDGLTFNPKTTELSVYFDGVKCVDCDMEVICAKHTPAIKRILYPAFVPVLEKAKEDGEERAKKLVPFVYGMVATHTRPYRGNKRLSLALINGMIHHTGKSAEDVYDSIQEVYNIHEGPKDEEKECALMQVIADAMQRGKEEEDA